MSGLTKEQLKNELISHGVDLPSPSARKEEYEQLYQKYVAPVEQSKGDFSSDDEDMPVNDVDAQASSNTSLVINGFDVCKLDDDELFAKLKSFGAVVGPIVDTTRMVYQKKLFALMGGKVVDSPTYNGDVDEDEYSDSEEEPVVEAKPVQTRPSFEMDSTKVTTTIPSSEIRKRILMSPGGESNQTGLIYDPERHTPSPRRSLRTVTSSSSETITVRRFINNGRSGTVTDHVDSKQVKGTSSSTGNSPSKTSILLRILVKLFFLVLIIAVALYFYQNNPSESPFKAVEELARQALEAAVGEEAVDSEVPSVEVHAEPAAEEVFPTSAE
ncbi:LEM protein 2-like isoform X2 [Homarus americanus]|uniref:LEM protein 2-like isoform X2 n=1 Tax=Homarus americanus TaxID=6706 RepID=UPI001C48A8CD|nr:LEM protein 2-like isoform X2 [Homarus americanus]